MYAMNLEEAIARNAVLESENVALRELVVQLQSRIEDLEKRLAANSRTSSKPPSSDPPWEKPRKKRGRPKKRKRGGQKGHAGRNRQMKPPEEVDRFVNHRPEACEKCDSLLLGEDPKPERWQLVEIPPTKPIVTEHRAHRLTCLCCGHVTKAEMPAGLKRSRFGGQVHAKVAWLTGRLGLSKRKVQEILSLFFGLDVSLGSVCSMERRVSEALKASYEEAWNTVRGSPVVHADETPWHENHALAWLWVICTPEVSVYRIQSRRNADAAKALFGDDFSGAACTDRHGAYNWIENHGYCWEHLKRNFESLSLTKGGHWYGIRLRASARRVMRTWYRHDSGSITTEEMRMAMEKERVRVERVLDQAVTQPHYDRVRNMAQAVLDQKDKLWTFLHVEGMPPDNNLAERAMRRGVLWRKGSFGTDSHDGSRFAERILTTVESLRAQDRNVIEFLDLALASHQAGRPAPSLIS